MCVNHHLLPPLRHTTTFQPLQTRRLRQDLNCSNNLAITASATVKRSECTHAFIAESTTVAEQLKKESSGLTDLKFHFNWFSNSPLFLFLLMFLLWL
ncbi:hypothetical protein GLYMA_17G206900v4 [Glycine max]|uniref:Uncharacterized protein n=2 Tax=Glycine subgen. Soja TaxID=1462606 RepID=K7MMY4_SOYBN|nr:hypothetical protein JHK86_048195 [Glycine max]KAG4944179.1 hypothetical protein JHK85_048825 [Glycine max]KAH1119353.1 hypothetical protein GYH30_047943 [Glycine max]KRH05095.1 hypothetical protein GLYMA_17G206900v4 [Glycine max]RZB57850.1 hypothetical protein D0Y65_046486 [Glycine soja]